MQATRIDIFTIITYLFMALLIFGRTKKALYKERFLSGTNNRVSAYSRAYWKTIICLVIILTFVATFRMVGTDIGGRDTLNYINEFLQSSNMEMSTDFLSEWLFSAYLIFIRYFTDNYRWFFFFSYLFIAWTYFLYIKKYGSTYYSSIPYLLLAWAFVKNFSSVRTGIAVALITIALVYIEKKKILSLILMIASIFVHRMSLLFIFVYLFYYLFKKYGLKISKLKLAIFIAIFISISVIAATRLQEIVSKFSILNSTDLWYLLHNKGNTLLEVWPMWFAHVLLLMAYLCVSRFETKESKQKIASVKTIFMFDIIILPMALTLGMYRANEYFFVNRMILWGYVVSLGQHYFADNSKKVYKTMILLLFVFWFVFRLISEGYDLGIMYYRFAL